MTCAHACDVHLSGWRVSSIRTPRRAPAHPRDFLRPRECARCYWHSMTPTRPRCPVTRPSRRLLRLRATVAPGYAVPTPTPHARINPRPGSVPVAPWSRFGPAAARTTSRFTFHVKRSRCSKPLRVRNRNRPCLPARWERTHRVPALQHNARYYAQWAAPTVRLAPAQ